MTKQTRLRKALPYVIVGLICAVMIGGFLATTAGFWLKQ